MIRGSWESKRPPLGVRLTVDIERFEGPRLTVWRAPIRWHDPSTGRWELVKRTHHSEEAALEWIERMQTGRSHHGGIVDRAIDRWETEYGRSTIKNTVAALVLVLDEAVRDGIVLRNPPTTGLVVGPLAA